MDNEIVVASEKGNQTLNPDKDFKGYTIEELRYQRALVALQKEFCKAKVIRQIDKIRNPNGEAGESKTSKLARIAGIGGKLLLGLNYLDYAMIGMSLFGSGRKIYNFFKGKKK